MRKPQKGEKRDEETGQGRENGWGSPMMEKRGMEERHEGRVEG